MKKLQGIDLHSHCIPEKMVGFLKKDNKPFDSEIIEDNGNKMVKIGSSSFPLSVEAVDPAEKLKSMDKMGIYHSVQSLSPRLFGYNLSYDDAVYSAKVANDSIAEFINYSPDRLSGMATVPLRFINDSVKELERVAGQLDMKAVQIGTHLDDKNLDDEMFYPFFEAAEDLGILILIHPYMGSPDKRMSKYYFNNLLGMAINTSVCLSSIILGGIIDRFQELKICFCHGGGFVPYQFGRLDHGYKVRDDVKNTSLDIPSSYLDKFYYDTITHSVEALEYLVGLVGSDRVVLGTDHPFDMGDYNPCKKVNSLKVTEKERHDILENNVADLFNLVKFQEMGI